MAVDCPNGIIAFTTVPEIVITGKPCVVFQTTVEGKIEVTNSPSIDLQSVDVGGPVTVTGTTTAGPNTTEQNATILRVDILAVDLTVNGNTTALVAGNTLQQGNLTVDNNVGAYVGRNSVNGNIQCVGNTELDEFGNRASGTKT